MDHYPKNLDPVAIKKIYLKIWRLQDVPKPSSGKSVPKGKRYHASTILAEINMNDISFFSSQQFLEGQSIVIEFQIPQKFTIHGEIQYCRSYAMKSQVISDKQLPYRGRARFTCARLEERNLLRKFVSSIEPPDANKNRFPFKTTPVSEPEQLEKKAS